MQILFYKMDHKGFPSCGFYYPFGWNAYFWLCSRILHEPLQRATCLPGSDTPGALFSSPFPEGKDHHFLKDVLNWGTDLSPTDTRISV